MGQRQIKRDNLGIYIIYDAWKARPLFTDHPSMVENEKKAEFYRYSEESYVRVNLSDNEGRYSFERWIMAVPVSLAKYLTFEAEQDMFLYYKFLYLFSTLNLTDLYSDKDFLFALSRIRQDSQGNIPVPTLQQLLEFYDLIKKFVPLAEKFISNEKQNQTSSTYEFYLFMRFNSFIDKIDKGISLVNMSN